MTDTPAVFLDREAVFDVAVGLLVPPGPDVNPALGVRVYATATLVLGDPANPAVVERVHQHVTQERSLGRDIGLEAATERALRELFGTEESDHGVEQLAAEQADPDADRDVAHRIIVALAAAFPLSREQRDAL
jgi:hypothetical protein